VAVLQEVERLDRDGPDDRGARTSGGANLELATYRRHPVAHVHEPVAGRAFLDDEPGPIVANLEAESALVRLAGLMLAALPLFLGFLPILLNKRRRGLQD
jgi:hypothetical protein